MRLSSPPHYDGRNYYVVDYYDDLNTLTNSIVRQLCRAGKVVGEPSEVNVKIYHINNNIVIL